MKAFLVVCVLLVIGVVGVAGLGFYMGWFHLSTDNADRNNPSVTIDVNEKKFQEDKKKVENLGDKAKAAVEPGDKSKEAQPRP